MKRQVMLFGHSDASKVHVDFGSLSKHFKPTATSLAVKLDNSLKLDAHISSVVKSGFFQLRQLAGAKTNLSLSHFEMHFMLRLLRSS